MLKTQINIHALFKITAGGGYGRNTQGCWYITPDAEQTEKLNKPKEVTPF